MLTCFNNCIPLMVYNKFAFLKKDLHSIRYCAKLKSLRRGDSAQSALQ
jgi:hypothetical protein